MSLKLVIPKGRMYDKVNALMGDAGIHIQGASRNYRPKSNIQDLEIKLLKSQNIPPLVALGQHDCGFAGLDWVKEQSADVTEILDLGFDPVRIVASIPEDWDWEDVCRKKGLIAVSEYRHLTTRWLESQDVDFQFLRSYGATEVFPPEDADLVVDNTATGSTLVANRLKVVGVIMESSTRFIANNQAMQDPAKREQIESMALLFRSVLEGRGRVLLEMNCTEDLLETIVDILPAMKSPTVSKLYKQDGYSVRAAVPKADTKELIPILIRAGATDILELPIRKVVP
jgi:ATP phosphoribosyltransferase